MKFPANATISRLQLRRLTYLAILVASVLATIFLLRAQTQREANLHDVAIGSAWQTQGSSSTGAMTIAAVRARFNISGGGATGDFAWQVTDVNELRTSLRALDAASVKLREVKITRRGAGFTVSAEQIQ